MIKKLLFICPLFFIILIVFLLSFLNTPLIIFPHQKYNDRISAYDDNQPGGASKIIDFKIFDNKIYFSSILKKSRISAFIGIGIDVSILDVSVYNIMEIHLASSSPACYLVNFMSFIKGETTLSELDSFAHFNKEFAVRKGKHIYKINVNSLVKTDHTDTKKKIKRPGIRERLKNLLFINLKEIENRKNEENARGFYNNIKKIIIEKISFHKTYMSFYIILSCITLLYYGFYLVFLVYRRKGINNSGDRQTPDIPLIQLDVETYKETDLKKIMHTFRQNVFDPEFSIHMMYKITGQSRKRIIKLVKDSYGLSFKQLMNSFRLDAAMKLLYNTNQKIYDIAFRVGYNDYSYFCKLFKKRFGLSPGEFRPRKNII